MSPHVPQVSRKSRRVMPLCAGEDGHADPYMIALSLVHLRFCELAALIHKFCQTGELSRLTLQWSNIVESLRKCGGALAHVRGTDWEARVRVIGHARIIDCEMRPLMLTWASAAKAELSKLKCEQKLRTKVAYDRWVDNQLRLGAGAPSVKPSEPRHQSKKLSTSTRPKIRR